MHKGQRIKTEYLLWLLVLAFLLAPTFFWKGGLLESEAILFVGHYLGSQSILQKIFDPRANDFGNYQARELSYFIDYLDAQSFRLLLAYDIPLFIPVSTVLVSLMTVFVFYVGVRKVMPKLNTTSAFLVLLLYLSNYVYVATMGRFYRSSKPFLVLVLLVTLFYVSKESQKMETCSEPGQKSKRFLGPFFCIFTLNIFMSLLDRQGFFYTAVLLVSLIFLYLFRRGQAPSNQICRFLLGTFCAVGVASFYNLYLAPWIINRIHGYRPDFAYQKIELELLTNPLYYVYAFEVFIQNTGIVLGSFPIWIYGGLGAMVIVWKFQPVRRNMVNYRLRIAIRHFVTSPTFFLACFLAGSQIVMFALMIMRHPPVYFWTDHRFWYYPLPFQIVLIFGLLVLLEKFLPELNSKERTVVGLLLVIMIISNVYHWGGYKTMMLQAPWFPTIYEQSSALKKSLQEGRPNRLLYGAYKTFYHYCVSLSPPLQLRAYPEIKEEEGFYGSERIGGRVVAWARKTAFLQMNVGEKGFYKIKVTFLALSKEEPLVISVYRKNKLLSTFEVRQKAGQENFEESSFTVALPEGKTNIKLLSQSSEKELNLPDDTRVAAFGILYPLEIERYETAN